MIHAGVTGDERKKAFVVGQRHALPDLIYTYVMTLWLNSTHPAREKRARFLIPTQWPSAKTNYTHNNLLLYKTEVIATTYKFPVQAPASPANFSRLICEHTQPLQHPEHAVAVMVIMSHGVAVAVVTSCGITVAVVVPRLSRIVCVGGGIASRGVVVVVVAPHRVVTRSWLLSSGHVVPQSQSSWSRRPILDTSPSHVSPHIIAIMPLSSRSVVGPW